MGSGIGSGDINNPATISTMATTTMKILRASLPGPAGLTFIGMAP